MEREDNPLITDISYLNTRKSLRNSKGTFTKLLFSDEDDFEQFIPVPPHNGTGGFRIIRMLDELGIIITNHHTGESPVVARADSLAKNFKFTFNLSPKLAVLEVEGNNTEHTAAPTSSYILSPKIVFDISILPYNHQKWLSVVIGPELLKQVIAGLNDRLPETFKSVVEKPDKDYYLHVSRYTPNIELVLEQVLNCPYSGSLKRLYLEGKAIELIALRLGLLLNGTGKGYHSVVLSHTDVEKLHYIESVLNNRIAYPPTIVELSNLVGLNMNKLKKGFKSIFGVPIGNYIRDLRMEKARYLLKKGGLDVSEAAAAVGYRSLSHFSLAFKERYGFYPHTITKMRNHFGR